MTINVSRTGAPLVDRYAQQTLKTPPLAYYRMREGTGTTLVDSGPGGLNGTYTSPIFQSTVTSGNSGKDGPLFNVDVNLNDTTGQGNNFIPATRVFFDGAATRATSTLTGINTGAASVVVLELWFKWDGNLAGSNGTFETLLNFGGATGQLFGFLKNGAADYRFGVSIRNAGDLWGFNNATTLALFRPDMWHHVVFVVTNNAIQSTLCYVNGLPYAMTQQIGTTTTTESLSTTFAIGYDGTTSFYQGQIGEVAIYNGNVMLAGHVLDKFHIGAYGGAYLEHWTLPGLEYVIDFGAGAFLNDPIKLQERNPAGQVALDTYVLTEIDGIDDPDVRWTAEPANAFDGEYGQRTRWGGRTLTLEGFIEPTNLRTLRVLQSRLKQQFNNQSVSIPPNSSSAGLFESTMIFRSTFDNFLDAQIGFKKSAPIQMKETFKPGNLRTNFLITTRSSSPAFESYGSRTEILTVGATCPLYNKGNSYASPQFRYWGPFSEARLLFGGLGFILLGTLAASTNILVDSKARTVSQWQYYNVNGGDFVYLNAQQNLTAQALCSFISVTGGTSATRLEITWRHTSI